MGRSEWREAFAVSESAIFPTQDDWSCADSKRRMEGTVMKKTTKSSISSYDVVVAAGVLHHLRDGRDWEAAFQKIFRLFRPGGSFWIKDLVTQESPPINDLMWKRYGAYLEKLGGALYRTSVLDYIKSVVSELAQASRGI
jgi:cyclopropane fatty-acyl-phospholipid synthase-like methyltransferase